jgi:hypothetical protein
MPSLRLAVSALVVTSTVGITGCGGVGVHAPNARQSLGAHEPNPDKPRSPPAVKAPARPEEEQKLPARYRK